MECATLDQRYSDSDQLKRDVPSFIEPRPPIITNPFMRPRPHKATNLLDLFEDDTECLEPELVQVYLRIKPCNVQVNNLYQVRSDQCLITTLDTATAGHGRRTQHNVSKMYSFSHIFRPESNQKEIFEHVVKGNLRRLPEGHNFTLLTYGASGSGKTYTLMGTVDAPGLVPRSLEYVFRIVDVAQQPLYRPSDGGAEKVDYVDQEHELQWVKKLRQISAPLRDKYRRMSTQLNSELAVSSLDLTNMTKYYIWVSFVEIYNEAVYDLLVNCDRRTATKLRIREDTNGNFYVKGARQAFVRSGQEAYDVMVAGKHNLQVAATGVHAQSSRSHCIFTITMLTETEQGIRTSCVRLCDLAGCERARRTRNTGARMQESRAINTSLHVLERCLHALHRKQRQGRLDANLVPYRESKLTRLLGAGLCGARGEAVSMLVTINPAPDSATETRHVLQLATVAADIQVNNTIAEYESLESFASSAASDRTLPGAADAMRLRADNERLHFELFRSQARIKELEAQMAERQRGDGGRVWDLLEDTKNVMRDFYEEQILALKEEIEDMKKEHENQIREMEMAFKSMNTPQKALQNKDTQLVTEIAILEEKLNAERLARATAEEEILHLRACIEERDDKGSNENLKSAHQDVVVLTDSEQESDDDSRDSPNESLEPNFRKQILNRSIHRNSLQKRTVDTEAVDKSTEETEDNDECFSDISADTVKDSSVQNDKPREPIDTTNQCDVSDKIYDASDTSQSDTFEEKTGRDSDENIAPSSAVVTILNKGEQKNTSHNTNDTLATDNETFEDKSMEISNNDTAEISKLILPNRGTYSVIDDRELTVDFDDSKMKRVVKKFRETYCVKKVDTESKTTQEEVTNIMKDNKDIIEPVIDIINEACDEVAELKTNFKTSKDFINSKFKSNNRSAVGSDVSLAQFEEIEEATENNFNAKKSDEVFSNIKILKEKRTFFDDNEPKTANFELNNVNILKEKRAYFDKTDVSKVNFETMTNKTIDTILSEMKVERVRSPSIVKDEVPSDYKPSSVTKLITESYTKNNDVTNSVNKIKFMTKKHDSVDMFEGFDSPHMTMKVHDKITTELKIMTHEINKENNEISIANNCDQSTAQVKVDNTTGFDSPHMTMKVHDKITTEPKIMTHEINEENNEISIANNCDQSTAQVKGDNTTGFDSPHMTMKVHDKITTELKIMTHEINEENNEISIANNCDQSTAQVKGDNTTGSDSPHMTMKVHDKITTEPKIMTHEINEENNEISIANNCDQSTAQVKGDNTTEVFESLCVDLTGPKDAEFELLLSQNATSSNEIVKKDENRNIAMEKAITESESIEKSKYNLRFKTFNSSRSTATNNEKVVEMFEVLAENKAHCESRAKSTKKNLRLRRRKNQNDDEGDKLKDIVNLQVEFSDVVLGLPAPEKSIRDIPSPDKKNDENLPPTCAMSCPSKSVTRSRRKLFTPRAEPLEEAAAGSGGGDSAERVRVPRPSYHRTTRARRRL